MQTCKTNPLHLGRILLQRHGGRALLAGMRSGSSRRASTSRSYRCQVRRCHTHSRSCCRPHQQLWTCQHASPALMPLSDSRLKPKHTKLIVGALVGVHSDG